MELATLSSWWVWKDKLGPPQVWDKQSLREGQMVAGTGKQGVCQQRQKVQYLPETLRIKQNWEVIDTNSSCICITKTH